MLKNGIVLFLLLSFASCVLIAENDLEEATIQHDGSSESDEWMISDDAIDESEEAADSRTIKDSICGVPDIESLGDKKKWSKFNLTFSFNNRRSGMPEPMTRKALENAFGAFSAVAPLTFREVDEGGDFHIRFARGEHDCFAAFDGRRGVVGHAEFPQKGRVHFDADERWTVMNATHLPIGTHHDFLSVAIHEIAHALGLTHVDDPSSIMRASYLPPVDRFDNYVAPKLDREVVKSLQKMYGAASTPAPRYVGHYNAPSRTSCLKNITAVVTIPGSRFMIFNDLGKRVTIFDTKMPRRAIRSLPVSKIFYGGPYSVTAAYFDVQHSFLMLFKFDEVWRYDFSNGRFLLHIGYPKDIRLPVGSRWLTFAVLDFIPMKLLVNIYESSVGAYNHTNNTVQVVGKLDEEYPNMPANVIGFADIDADGTYVGLTRHHVFTYDFKSSVVEVQGRVEDFLWC